MPGGLSTCESGGIGGLSDELGLGALKLQEQGELNLISVQLSKRKNSDMFLPANPIIYLDRFAFDLKYRRHSHDLLVTPLLTCAVGHVPWGEGGLAVA